MIRVTIKNLNNEITNQVEMEDPSAWIASGVAENWWGLGERIKWKDECSDAELLEISLETPIEVTPAVPEIPAVLRTRYLLSENPDVWKWVEDCTPAEIAAAIRNEQVEISPAIPEVPAVTRIQVTLRAQYTITQQDMQPEIDAANQKAADIMALKSRLRALAQQADLTADDVKEATMKTIQLDYLQNALDD